MSTLQPMLKEADTNPAISALAGEVFLQSGDVKKAEEYFAKATRQDPKNARTRTALALTHLASGNYVRHRRVAERSPIRIAAPWPIWR